MRDPLSKSVVRKLTAQGWVFCHERVMGSVRYWARKPGNLHLISFIDQGGNAICLRVRREDDQDDPQSDYSAGSYAHSIKQALRLAEIR